MSNNAAAIEIPSFLTVSEVAEVLKLNPLTIYAYIQKGELSAVKFGRYYRVSSNELEVFIKNKTVTRSS